MQSLKVSGVVRPL